MFPKLPVLVLVSMICVAVSDDDDGGNVFTNDWSVHVAGGVEHAKIVANDTGCQYGHEIIPGEDYYLFHCHKVSRRDADPDHETHQDIDGHPHVTADTAEQQKVLNRTRRAPLSSTNTDEMYLNDPEWGNTWYLNRGDMLDMNVQEAWDMGITGKGVVVSILDDGIEKDHPDLVSNYDQEASYDINDNDYDPSPRYDATNINRHGTRCAGEVAASANNSICSVGIAYESKVGGVRMLDGDVTDAVEARSLSLNMQHIDIYSASWGPDDDGRTVDGPGTLARRAFEKGITKGRHGKGSIFVWASGNGGKHGDNCNCDGYTNSIWTLSVASASEDGQVPWYSESCSSTLATTYSSGSKEQRKVVTTDLHHGCTASHTGTSASAPMAAAIIALVLQVNPKLSWRDVQHITVRNCHKGNLGDSSDWRVNSLGRSYSHNFGYGLMDATGMVKMASNWQTVGEQVTSSVEARNLPLSIPAKSKETAEIVVTRASRGQVRFLEHVQAHVTLDSTIRGDLSIYLTSPQGTKSQLLTLRSKDTSSRGFQDWPFLTVFCWGEDPEGTWVLEVENQGGSEATLSKWSLKFHGTEGEPNKSRSSSSSSAGRTERVDVEEEGVSNCAKLARPGWCSRCKEGYWVLGGMCVEQCREGYYQEGGSCKVIPPPPAWAFLYE